MTKTNGKALVKRVLCKIAASNYVQGCLEKNVRVSQYLMGIGSGSEVSSSGEDAVFRELKQKTNPPYCIFDIGANKGQFLQVALDNIGLAHVAIHCFEPGHETYRSLVEMSVRLNVGAGVKLNNFALGERQGTATLHFDRSGSALASLTKRDLDHFGIAFGQSETVEVDTVDRYCRENAVRRVDLLKIDVEGHEIDVLRGATEMFQQHAIGLVSFEFGGTNIDTRTFFRDFWQFFTNVKMQIFRISPSGFLAPIRSYQEAHEQFVATNFLAAPGSR
jgi:FkbM family methyltransferase